LIINADDYGHTAGVSAGIRDGHLHGVVSSTTTMMNMGNAEDALEKAKQECPNLGLGVHLVLTTGRPVLPITKVSSLVTPDGFFPEESELIFRLSSLNMDEVMSEWQAQIERFVAVIGHVPDHLDSHHHISFLNSQLFQIMLELATTYQCAIRFPDEETAKNMLEDFPINTSVEIRKTNLQLLNQYLPLHPDKFIKTFYDENANTTHLIKILNELPNGTTEIMCHPGYVDEELIINSSYQQQREGELAVLKDQNIKDYLSAHEIELINFKLIKT
jgi:chitin disaccharide deacetylase